MIKQTKRSPVKRAGRLNVASAIAVIALHAFVILPPAVYAGPGAHGPDGQHLDGPSNAGGPSSASPRVEAKTDLFELVGNLTGGKLSVLIDRFSTNEPLLNANVEVESGSLKASAKFHEDLGDYTIADPAFLKAISLPGAHPLVFTVVSGDESDLLDGTLTVGSTKDVQSRSHDQTYLGISRPIFIGLGVIALLLVGGLYFRSRMKRNSSRTYEGSR